MLHSFRLIPAMALMTAGTAFAQAQPWEGGAWHVRKTDQGCLYYSPSSSTEAEEKTQRRTWYFSIRWEGSPCTPGALINGRGTLVEVQNLAVISADGPGKSVVSYSGTMTNGLWNGPVNQSEVYRGSLAYSVTRNYVMGCMTGSSSGGCAPPNAGPTQQAYPSRGAPSAIAAPDASAPSPVPSSTDGGNVWATCVSLEDPVQSGIQVIYAFRNNCTKRITISFCMKATFEAAGDWNLCSQRSYKTYDVAAGQRFEFPFTPVTDGEAMSDGRVVRNQEVRASGAACIGSSPSVYIENKELVFQHC